MTTAIYIHGYNGKVNGNKVNVLREAFDGVISIDYPEDFSVAFDFLKKTVCELVEKHKTDGLFLVGSSLGGYYADKIASYHNLPVILINPVVDVDDLIPIVGNVSELKKCVGDDTVNGGKLILLAEDDDLLDYKKAKSFYQTRGDVVIEKTGGHRFNNKKLKQHIERFLDENFW